MNRADKFQQFASTRETRKDLKRNSVRAFGYILTSSGGEFVLRFGSAALLARLVDPQQQGLFLMVTAVTAIADQFRDLGLSTATIQREDVTHHQVSNLFWINTGAGALLTLIVAATSPLVATYFNEPRLTLITLALSANFVFGGLTVQHEALLSRQLKQGQKAAMRLLSFFIASLIAVVMAYYDWGYWALVWREVIRSILIAVGAWIVCPWIPSWYDRRVSVRDFLGFGKDLTLTFVLGIISGTLDRFLIGRVYGPEPVALYRQPYQLVVAPMGQFMNPLYQVALPGLSMVQSEPVRYRNFYRRIVSLVAIMSMPLCVYFAVYAHEFTVVVLGNRWIESAVFLQIFALGGILRFVSMTIGFVLMSRGRSKPLLKLGIANCLVMIALMSIGLRWGPEGVAVGEAMSIVVMFFPWMYFSFRDSPVSIPHFLSALVRPAAASAFMALALIGCHAVWTPPTPLVGLIVGAVTSLVAFGASWLLLPGGLAELKTLLGDIASAVKRKSISTSS